MLEIDDQADLMAAVDLLAREVDDMPEQPAQRRPQHVDDLQARGRRGGHECSGLVTRVAAS
ncbi:MAG: hypothetical protein V9G24_07985 [Rhodoblastus sp.]